MPTPFRRNVGLSSAPAVLDRDGDMLDLPDFMLRPLTPDDAAIVARHRAAMFHEMGSLAALRHRGAARRRPPTTSGRRSPSGEYHGWLALRTWRSPTPASEVIVGGAGIQLRPLLPRPEPTGGGLLCGRQGLILNVYVQPAFRRRASRADWSHAVLDWARSERLAGVVLHASEAGRPLYEQLGFVATNEMRFTGTLTRRTVRSRAASARLTRDASISVDRPVPSAPLSHCHCSCSRMRPSSRRSGRVSQRPVRISPGGGRVLIPRVEPAIVADPRDQRAERHLPAAIERPDAPAVLAIFERHARLTVGADLVGLEHEATIVERRASGARSAPPRARAAAAQSA